MLLGSRACAASPSMVLSSECSFGSIEPAVDLLDSARLLAFIPDVRRYELVSHAAACNRSPLLHVVTAYSSVSLFGPQQLSSICASPSLELLYELHHLLLCLVQAAAGVDHKIRLLALLSIGHLHQTWSHISMHSWTARMRIPG
eukprot:GHRR01029210.1.p1 GENE.GHRR01029210.1~~GHRR01029210.1.p1  ORF type:complete len:144 (+),score=11.01 GHRR01029210.1:51-482(+)